MKINQCKCGGIPYIAQHYDSTYDEILYYVKCYKCGNNSRFELTDDIAIDSWNKDNPDEPKTTTRT